MYIRWYADLLWLFVPVQQQIRALYADYQKYPHQDGASLNAAGINYQSIKLMQTLQKLESREQSMPAPSN